jgi:hypothetical protein
VIGIDGDVPFLIVTAGPPFWSVIRSLIHHEHSSSPQLRQVSQTKVEGISDCRYCILNLGYRCSLFQLGTLQAPAATAPIERCWWEVTLSIELKETTSVRPVDMDRSSRWAEGRARQSPLCLSSGSRSGLIFVFWVCRRRVARPALSPFNTRLYNGSSPSRHVPFPYPTLSSSTRIGSFTLGRKTSLDSPIPRPFLPSPADYIAQYPSQVALPSGATL